MNSPWGLYYSIIKETGFTWDYLMWGISWINVQMMLADAPKYKSKPKSTINNTPSFEDFKDFED